MKIDFALGLAEQGFRVFPLQPNGKKPATPDGFYSGTRRKDIIESWWTDNPNWNIGVATGGDFFVVDVDNKNGKAGLASLAELELLYDLPQSYSVATTTGGLHIYLAKEETLKLLSDADHIDGFPGIDIRAEGGYVVGPGSTIDGIEYIVATDIPMAEAPTAFLPILKRPLAERKVDTSIELDLPQNVTRAIDYLQNHAKEAIEGAAGDATTFEVAAELRAKGISESLALELMLEHWNETKAHPPWQPDELAIKVANGFQYGQGAPGGKTAAGEFGEVDLGVVPATEAHTEIPTSTDKKTTITARPYFWTDPATLPPREWLLGRHLIRKFVSNTVAPGNIGKSSLLVSETLEMVSGKNLIGHTAREPLRVWYWNLEDPYDELQRRFQAAAQHFGLTREDMTNRLYVDSGRDQALRIAVADKNGTRIVKPVVDQLVNEMQLREIDVLIVDPFVSSHAVPENDNSAIDMVAKEWGRVADWANAAIELVHHTRKQGNVDTEITTESSRGGKALTDAARDVRVLNRMSKDEGAKAGVENHRLHFRTYSDKANMSPPADHSDWFKLESVSLANGDEVGVVARWEWPDPFAEITDEHVRKVQAMLTRKEYRANVQANDWVGNAIGEVVGLDPKAPADREKIKAMAREWIDKGWLVVREARDEKGNKRPIVVSGEQVQEKFDAVEI